MKNPITKINDELVKWQELSAILSQEDIDAETLVDTLDGETELMEALCVVADSILDDNTMIDGIKSTLEKLNARKSRIEKAAETKRNIILQAMDRADIKTVTNPLFTLTKRIVPPKAMVVDESLLPSRFFEPQPPKLNKKALNDAIKGGEDLEGVEMSNGGLSLTMRIK